jgi:hypothetical protein
MFTILVLLMLAAIALSVFGREGRGSTARPMIRRTVARARVMHQKAKRRYGPAIALVGGALFLLALAMLMDYRILVQPDATTAASGGQAAGPGPGWKTDQGAALPPSGFTGRAVVRFEQGVSAKGLAVVAHGQFKRVGWRITGQDAAYCFLEVELEARPAPRKLDTEGYSTTDAVLDEGWHEATVHAWCPQGHANARFDIATRTVSPINPAEDAGPWTEAGDADIRHR